MHKVVLLLGVSGVVVVDVGNQCVGVVVFGACVCDKVAMDGYWENGV